MPAARSGAPPGPPAAPPRDGRATPELAGLGSADEFAFAEATDEVFWIAELEPEVRLDYVNTAFERVYGRARAELERDFKLRCEVIVPEERAAATAAFERWRHAPAGERLESEYRIARPDGSVRAVGERCFALATSEGRVTRVAGITRDISDQKSAESELLRGRVTLATAERIAHLGSWEWDLPAKSWHWSGEIYRMLGCAPETFRPDSDAVLAMTHPDDRTRVREAVRAALAGECRYSIDHRVLKHDGTVLTVHSEAEVLREPGGTALRMVGTMLDITERKRTEDELRESSLYARTLIEASLDPFLTISPSGLVTDVNRAAELVTGLARSALVGSDFASHFTEPERARRACQTALEEGALRDYALTVRHSGGRTTDVLCNATLYRDASGAPQGIFAAARDVTERNALEAQLRQAQKMEAIGALAGGIAHDFNNLLTAIRTFAGFLKDEMGVDTPGREDVAEILAATERASKLTRQLLTFARRQVTQPTSLDLNDVVGSLDKMLRRLIGEDVELVTMLDKDAGRVWADAAQTEQIIMNLAVNARDAMPQGGKLVIEVSSIALDASRAEALQGLRAGPYVTLTISDTGIGMSDEVKARLFEPFFTTKPMGKGTGLGLATAYGIVRQNAGGIAVQSRPGEGATFKIFFPRLEQEAPRATQNRRVAAPTAGNETILVVEDDPLVRRAATRMLRRAGYTVLDAPSASDALAVVERHSSSIALVLTDIVMPLMSGRELADRLKVQRPELPIVFMSGYTDDAIVHHGVLEHGVRFVEKPFTEDALLRAVRETLDAASPPSHASPTRA